MAANPELHLVSSPEAPHAVAAERALLGALLYNNDLWDDLDGKLAVDHFYDKRHQIIFAALQKLLAEGRADSVILAQTLRDGGKLGDGGGEEYVRQIESISAAENNVAGYAAEIQKSALLRRMHSTLHAALARVMHPDGVSPVEILDDIEARLGELAVKEEAGGRRMTSVSEESIKLFDNLAEIVNNKDFDRLLGLQTGYPRLDKMTTGLHGGELIIIAARPGGGKTAFALNIVRHISAEKNAGVVVFSLEMSDKHLVSRLVSQDRVEMQKLRTAKDYNGSPMNSRDLIAFGDAVERLQNREVYIDDSGALSILELKSRARRLARQLARRGGRLSLVVVDYLQLLTAPDAARDNRAQEVAEISRGLKALAKELNVPVVALSQLNRSAKERAAKKPLLSDLRESGAIEQDADIVMFLHEEEPGDDEEYAAPPPEGTQVKLIIGKQRNGPTGNINLRFHKEFSRFAEVARADF